MLNRRSIRIKVLQHIYSYEHNVGLSDDIDSLKSHTLEDLKKSISNIDSFLYQLLSLSLSFREIDSRKREINEKSLTKKNKLKFNFSNNKVLEFLGENEKIKSEIIDFKSSLGSEEELIKDWYKLLIKESFFNEYNNLENPTFNDDLEFVRKLILSFFLKNEDINSFFEARNIYWDIDKQIIKSMLKKTFESLNSRDFNTFAVASLSENIEEDIKFACSLLYGCCGNYSCDVNFSIRSNAESFSHISTTWSCPECYPTFISIGCISTSIESNPINFYSVPFSSYIS